MAEEHGGGAHPPPRHLGAGRQRAAAPPKGDQAQAKKDCRLAFALFTLGALIVAALTVASWDYYWLPRMERLLLPLHEALRSAGTWGHGVGIGATAVMLSNFLYSARKRWRFLKGAAPIRRWLTFHVFVGFMSPVVIGFHAAFQSNNALASATTGSLAVVVLTGMIGRFIYGLVPTRDGRAMEYADVAARWERLKARVEPLLEGVADPAAVRRVLSIATAPARSGLLLALFFRLPFESLGERWHLARVRKLFEARSHYRDFRDAFLRLSRLRVQVGFYRSLKKLLAGWRVFHVVLALLLVVMITAHIGLSLFLGYWWIF